MFTLNGHQSFTLIHPYPTYRYVYIEWPSELRPYSPLSHLQICLHWIAIRISPLFALIWPYRHIYMQSPSWFRPYSPLSGLTDMFTLNHHQNFTLIRPYPTYRYVYIESPSEFRPYSPLSHMQTCLSGLFLRSSWPDPLPITSSECSPDIYILIQYMSSCRQTIIHSILYDIYLHSHTKVQILRWRPQDCSPVKNISMFQPLSLSDDDPFNLQIVDLAFNIQ